MSLGNVFHVLWCTTHQPKIDGTSLILLDLPFSCSDNIIVILLMMMIIIIIIITIITSRKYQRELL